MMRHKIVATGLTMILVFVMLAVQVVAGTKPAPTGKVNINTATVEQLVTLPGIGVKLATRIVEYRQKSGTFKSTQELMNVSGIGEKNFQKIQTYLSVGENSKSSGTTH